MRIFGEQILNKAMGFFKNLDGSKVDHLKSILGQFKKELGAVEDYVISKSHDWAPHVQRLAKRLDEEIQKAKESGLQLEMEKGIDHFVQDLKAGQKKPIIEVVN